MDTNTVLQLNSVSKNFGGLQAVCDVQMRVTHGQRHGLIGTNGAGKTTLFNLIAGDLPVSTGTIVLFGTDVTTMPVHKRTRLGLRRTYQTPALFNGLTVRENLYLALLGNDPPMRHLSCWKSAFKDTEKLNLVQSTAETVELSRRLDDKVGDLSHGERKQLEIGMVLSTNPRLLLLDEPAAGLSVHEREVMKDLLRSIASDITLFIIEHDMDMVIHLADRITVMYDGVVLAEGDPKQIQADPDVQRVYLGEAINGTGA
ncbi:MAG: ABC transporter ATP-binding protein [Spirochaetaceae bacterium]|nr:MAG: ABC transporter ATP-binding protein [Spirochaetaceae bacterium]